MRVIDAETGKADDFHARVVFLNASTLTTTGLLLHSASDRFPNGFANGGGVLGHYLMDHTNAAGATAATRDSPTSTTRDGAPRACTSRASGTCGPAEGRAFTRGYAYEVYTGRSGWQQRKDAPGLGAELKESLTRPGAW